MTFLVLKNSGIYQYNDPTWIRVTLFVQLKLQTWYLIDNFRAIEMQRIFVCFNWNNNLDFKKTLEIVFILGHIKWASLKKEKWNTRHKRRVTTFNCKKEKKWYCFTFFATTLSFFRLLEEKARQWHSSKSKKHSHKH